MGVILSSLLAYIGVYAGVLLGSFSPEELPVGRYRLRIVQLILLVLLSLVFLQQIIVHSAWIFILLFIGLVLVELAFIFDTRLPRVFTQPKHRTLLVYALLGASVLLASVGVQFLVAVLVFLYGLVSGSLVAEPYVHDRRILHWKKPYGVAFSWTWSYLLVWVIVVFFVYV